jgi:electron transport complex protein RnfC
MININGYHVVACTDEELCMGCGNCATVCPVNLLPSRLARLSELDRFEEAKELGLETCMECGSCAYTCPAHIPHLREGSH